MKVNQLKLGVILSYLQMGLNAAISLAYTPVMLRLLGQSEYGVYTLASSMIACLGLLNFGLSSSYIRYYSRYKKQRDAQGLAQLNGVFFIVYFVIAMAALAAGITIGFHVKDLFGAKLTEQELERTKSLMVILSFHLMITFLSTVFTAFVHANEGFIFQKVLSIVKTVLSPLVTIPVLLLGGRSIGMAVVTTVISAAVALSNVLFCLKKLHMRFAVRGANYRLIGEIASYSVFIAINSIVDQINWQVDKFILSRYCGTAATAIYGVAAQINTLYISMSVSISSVFIPRVHCIADSRNENQQFTQLFTKIGRIQMLVLGLVGSGLILYGASFIRIWAGENYADAYPIMLLLVLPGTIPLIQNLGIEIQRAKNKHQFRSIVYLLMALLNAGISVVLGKRFGGIGCAMGTAASMLLANGLMMNWIYQKKINLEIAFFWRQIARLFPAILFSGILGWIFTAVIAVNSLRSLLFAALIYGAIYCLICWTFAMNRDEKALIMRVVEKLTGGGT